MAAVIPEEGLMNLLSLVTGAGWDFEVRLYKNDLTPDPATVMGDLTPATYSGYAPIPLSDLPDPELTPGGKARVQMGEVSFLHDGGPVANSCYGYYVVATQGDDELFLWAERFEEAPFMMASLDDEIPVTVVITDTQEV